MAQGGQGGGPPPAGRPSHKQGQSCAWTPEHVHPSCAPSPTVPLARGTIRRGVGVAILPQPQVRIPQTLGPPQEGQQGVTKGPSGRGWQGSLQSQEVKTERRGGAPTRPLALVTRPVSLMGEARGRMWAAGGGTPARPHCDGWGDIRGVCGHTHTVDGWCFQNDLLLPRGVADGKGPSSLSTKDPSPSASVEQRPI